MTAKEKNNSGGECLRVVCEGTFVGNNQKLSLDFKRAGFFPILADGLIYFQMTNGA